MHLPWSQSVAQWGPFLRVARGPNPFSEHGQDGEPLPPLCANRNFFRLRGLSFLVLP